MVSDRIAARDQEQAAVGMRRGPSADRPIGVFDSGVGGLSVMHEIRALLPAEDLLYVADSGHCPYGGKPEQQIQERALRISRFLLDHGAKAIVVACNTASVAALNLLRATFDVPIIGMEPGVKPAVAATRSGVVGVLATGVTLAGSRFHSLVERFAREVEVITQPCPGLVEQVEEGDLEGERTVALLRTYIDPLMSRGADTLVLGCTHYPFLRSTIAQLVGPEVTLIETGSAVARQTARVLHEHGLLTVAERAGGERFFASGSVASVEVTIRKLWNETAAVEALPV